MIVDAVVYLSKLPFAETKYVSNINKDNYPDHILVDIHGLKLYKLQENKVIS